MNNTNKKKLPVGVRSLDVYSTNIHSMLEPLDTLLQEGFTSEQTTGNNTIDDLKTHVQQDVNELNRGVERYHHLKDLIKNDVMPLVNDMYPVPPTASYRDQLENESQRSLKMQFQDDTRSLIEGTSNLFVISAITIATFAVFAVIVSV